MADRVSITWRPLTQWPAGRAKTQYWQREDAAFARGEWKSNEPGNDTSGAKWTKTRTPLSRTLAELDRELYMISAKNVVIQLDAKSEGQFRRDGTGPLSGASMQSPAVVVSFMRKNVPYVFAGDYFKRWEDNLRAIALGLEGLRRMERYHIAQAGDQYRGWQALPAAGATTPTLSTAQAAHLVARLAGSPDVETSAAGALANRTNAEMLVRIARSKTHPDAGGRNEDWTLLQEAQRILNAHHGVAA